jgi:hypothetical protein
LWKIAAAARVGEEIIASQKSPQTRLKPFGSPSGGAMITRIECLVIDPGAKPAREQRARRYR